MSTSAALNSCLQCGHIVCKLQRWCMMNTCAPILRASEASNFGPSLQGHWAKGSPHGSGAYARAIWAYADAIWGCPVVLELPDAHNLKSCLCNSQDLWSVRLMTANCLYPIGLPHNRRNNDELCSIHVCNMFISYVIWNRNETMSTSAMLSSCLQRVHIVCNLQWKRYNEHFRSAQFMPAMGSHQM